LIRLPSRLALTAARGHGRSHLNKFIRSTAFISEHATAHGRWSTGELGGAVGGELKELTKSPRFPAEHDVLPVPSLSMRNQRAHRRLMDTRARPRYPSPPRRDLMHGDHTLVQSDEQLYSVGVARVAVNLKLLIAQILGMFVVFALALFGAAGTVAWPAGWVFLILFFGFVIGLSAWLASTNPGLLTERMTGIGKPDQKWWDRIFFTAAQAVFLAWLISMPLDAVRFRWSTMPLALQILGALLLVGSFLLLFLTFKANPYLSPAVRIQRERGQAVIDSGPYRFVRHPMYAGAGVLIVGTSLLLASWWGLLVGLLVIVGVALRAVQEERTLANELHGYTAYMQRVRSRMLPHVW
jgi:protein-S-isoprenylcysteine O-methyltransferase Ste14